MAFTGFMKVPDIEGESLHVDHENEIDLDDIRWGLEREQTSFRLGRVRGRIDTAPVEVSKVYDAASPYIAQAVAQGKSFDEIVITVRRDSGDAHLDYLIITMTNCIFSDYQMIGVDADGTIGEEMGISYEKITLKYTEQAEDGSAGDEHEVEIDAHGVI